MARHVGVLVLHPDHGRALRARPRHRVRDVGADARRVPGLGDHADLEVDDEQDGPVAGPDGGHGAAPLRAKAPD